MSKISQQYTQAIPTQTPMPMPAALPSRQASIMPVLGALLTALILGVVMWQGIQLARQPRIEAPAVTHVTAPSVPAALNPAVAQPDAPGVDMWTPYEHPTAYRVLVRTEAGSYLYACLDGACEYSQQEADTLRTALMNRGGSPVMVTPRNHAAERARAALPGWGGYPANGPTPRPMDDNKVLARLTYQKTAGSK